MKWIAVAKSTAVVVIAAPVISACGGGDEDRPRLVVSAASSLTGALTECSRDFQGADVRLQFAGSDELAAQIRGGVKPDLFAAANTRLPDELNSQGLLEAPVVFATNALVVAVPAGSERVRSLNDLAKAGTKLAIGSESVPVGTYTREVISRLAAGRREAMLANVRSEEPDVRGVVGKLTQQAVDAGFVYESDVKATKGRLRLIALPDRLQPTVRYGAGVVKGTDRGEEAREYLRGLVEGECAESLRESGFGPAR